MKKRWESELAIWASNQAQIWIFLSQRCLPKNSVRGKMECGLRSSPLSHGSVSRGCISKVGWEASNCSVGFIKPISIWHKVHGGVCLKRVVKPVKRQWAWLSPILFLSKVFGGVSSAQGVSKANPMVLNNLSPIPLLVDLSKSTGLNVDSSGAFYFTVWSLMAHRAGVLRWRRHQFTAKQYNQWTRL